MSTTTLVGRFDAAYERARRPRREPHPIITAHVCNEDGFVTVRGPKPAVNNLIAFIKRNRGK